MLPYIITAVVSIIITALVVWFAAASYQKKSANSKIGNAEEKARGIIDEAVKTAEEKKRESMLEIKEESIKAKNDLDKEIKERRNEISRNERRIVQKEENVDKKLEAIEKREAGFAVKEEELKKQKIEISKLNEQRLQELERISGLTSEQAKEYLLKTIEEDVKLDTAKMIKEMENKAKEEANRKAKDYVVTAIQKCAADHVSETTISVVSLPNDEMKGRIIGREGRNIRTLETMTGVDLIIKPKIITPQVSMTTIGMQTPLNIHTQNTYLQQTAFSTSIKLNMPNEGWKFKVLPETDEDILHFLVDQYSIETGKIHKLLPASAYDIPVIEFEGEERSKALNITVKYQAGMTDGDYLLPVILKEVEGMPFEVDANTCYIPVNVTDGMIQIKPTENDIAVNSNPDMKGKLFDGGVGEGLFWESYYYTVEGVESYCDPTYGIYVDISNLDKKITKAMNIRLSAYAYHTLATKVQIYAQTADNAEWTLIKTTDNTETVAPVFPNAQKKTDYLLELDGGHIRELEYKDCGEITAVRIAFLESRKGNLTDITAANVGSKLVGLAEIEIFGY